MVIRLILKLYNLITITVNKERTGQSTSTVDEVAVRPDDRLFRPYDQRSRSRACTAIAMPRRGNAPFDAMEATEPEARLLELSHGGTRDSVKCETGFTLWCCNRVTPPRIASVNLSMFYLQAHELVQQYSACVLNEVMNFRHVYVMTSVF